MAPLVGIAYCLIIVRYGMDGAFKTAAPFSSVRFSPHVQDSTPSAAEEGIAVKSFVAGVAVSPAREAAEPDLSAKADCFSVHRQH